MRNLKKVLAMVLALVMSMSLVTVANAASFSDADDIQYTEAVDVLTALKVIDGVGNNTFNPNGNVTRAQMAKMITIVALGNVEPSAFLGTATDLTDINGHWAEAYIKYCYSQGIIAGKGNGRFDPNANVTAAEASKMLLVALGYNSKVQGYTGAQWTINVARDAQTSKFYEDLSVPAAQALTRDQAAQLIYNAVQAPMIEKTSTVDRVTGNISDHYAPFEDGRTLLLETFGAETFVGTFQGNHSFHNAGSTVKGDIVVSGMLTTENITTHGPANDANFPYEFDMSNIGEEVKVIFKDGTGGIANQPDKKDTIYGVFNTGSTTVYKITKDDIQDVDTANDKIKFGDTKYDYVTGGDLVINYGGKAGVSGITDATIAGLEMDSADELKLVCNDNGKIEDIYVLDYDFDVVVGVTADNFNLRTLGMLPTEGNTLYDGMAQNDVVKVLRLYENVGPNSDATYVVEKAETLTGTVTKFYDAGKVAVDGTDVSVDANAAALPYSNGAARYNVTNTFTNTALGKNYEFVMYGDRYVAAMPVNATSNYAVIIAATNGDAINGQSVKVLLADGNTKTYTTSIYSNVGDNDNGAATYYDTLPATDLDAGDSGILVTYTVDNDGKIDMDLVNNTQVAGETNGFNKNDKTISDNGTNRVLAADAVAFVKDSSNEWKVYNANALDTFAGTNGTLYYDLDVSTTPNRVKAFAVETAATVSIATVDYEYMFITKDAYAEVEGGKTYTHVTGVDETGNEVSFTVENNYAASATLAVGNFLQYKQGANEYVKMSDIEVSYNATRVTGYDASQHILYDALTGQIMPVYKDVVIIGVDSANREASVINTIPDADLANIGNLNVVYFTEMVDGVNTIVAVFVDVTNNMKVNTVAAANTVAAIETALGTNTSVSAGTAAAPVTVTVASSDALDVPTGKTLTVYGNITLTDGTSALNVASGATLIVTGTITLNGGTLDCDGVVRSTNINLGSTISGAGTLIFQTATISGNMTISMDATGTLNIAGAIAGDGSKTLSISGGNVSISGTVQANVTVSGTAEVTTGNVSGNVTASGSATVETGAVSGNVTASGSANVATGTVTGSTINNSTGTVTENGTASSTTIEDILKAALAYAWADNYQYNVTPTISGSTVTYSGTHAQFATKVQGVGSQIFATSADMARLLGGVYHIDSDTSIVFAGQTYTWDADNGLTGSNWVDSNGATLVSALATQIATDFRNGDTVKTEAIEKTYTITIGGEVVSLKFVKAAADTSAVVGG